MFPHITKYFRHSNILPTLVLQNDGHVMQAWQQQQDADAAMVFVADVAGKLYAALCSVFTSMPHL